MSDKRTASQRIEDLERAVMSIYQASNGMARDLGLIKNAMKLIDSKISAIMEASVSGKPLTDEVVGGIMREKELEDFKGKVTELVSKGFLVATETLPENAFVVGYEAQPDAADGTPGKVMHARLQFTLASLDKEIQEKFKGSKVGDTVSFGEGALVFKIQELYQIVNPTPVAEPVAAEAAPATETESSAPVTTFAPAETQSSSDASTAQADSSAAPSQSAGN